MSVSPQERPTVKARKRKTIALMVPRESGLYASAGAFWRLCQANPDLRLERTARGEVIVMPPAGSDSGWRNGMLTMRLGIWTEADGTGIFFDSSAGFTLHNGKVAAADAAWIVRERWLAVPAKLRKRFAPIGPDFVVEITSPSDELKDAREKMVEYIDQGVRLGWLLDPKSEVAEIYRPGRTVETLRRPKTLSGEDVLPGFVLDLNGILFDCD
jgi:Uma2 family endonuclease